MDDNVFDSFHDHFVSTGNFMVVFISRCLHRNYFLLTLKNLHTPISILEIFDKIWDNKAVDSHQKHPYCDSLFHQNIEKIEIFKELKNHVI